MRDENHVIVGMGVSSLDRLTPLPFLINPVTGKLLMKAYDEGLSDAPALRRLRDENNIPVAAGVSESDGVTVLPFTLSPQNRLLII